MKKRIYNISGFNYKLNNIFGKIRKTKKMIIETKNEDGNIDRQDLHCDYIVTIGKNAIIITTPCAEKEANSNKAVIVAPWKKQAVEYIRNQKIKMTCYQDIDGYYWMFTQDKIGQMISMYNKELTNQIIHLEFK
jgi:hypothetical protein